MPGRRAPLAARFWSKVDRSAGMHACWPWTGAVVNRNQRIANGGRYGHLRTAGRGSPMIKVHRYALVLATGEDFPELVACHALFCTTTLCVNAWNGHLRWGTHEDNIADWIAKYGTHRLASTRELIEAVVRRLAVEQKAESYDVPVGR